MKKSYYQSFEQEIWTRVRNKNFQQKFGTIVVNKCCIHKSFEQKKLNKRCEQNWEPNCEQSCEQKCEQTC